MLETDVLFSSSDYRVYLTSALEKRSLQIRGVRSRLAEAMGCQPGYLTRILDGTADLSLEQADHANRFLEHSEEESRFFLLLVERERAGTARLKMFFEKELETMRRARLDLKERFKTPIQMSAEQQSRYFSHWYYAAIHAAVSVPGLGSRSALVHALELPEERVEEALTFLLSTGLVREDAGKLQVGTVRMHLGNDSALISKHHVNWRLQALRALEKDSPDHLHYSSVVTISREDYIGIKAELVRALENAKSTVRGSKDEIVCSLSLDWFQLNRE